MEEIAAGWANQIKLLADSMQASPVEAAKFIVDMKKIENLLEVAKGPNNSTYFFPQKDDLVPQSKMVGDMMKEVKTGVNFTAAQK
jgi:transposase